jgi:hypothetical protein
MIAVAVNNKICLTVGQRRIAIVSFFIIPIHQPFPIVVVVYSIAGFANDLIDSAWNAWIGDMAQFNELLGSIPLLDWGFWRITQA